MRLVQGLTIVMLKDAVNSVLVDHLRPELFRLVCSLLDHAFEVANLESLLLDYNAEMSFDIPCADLHELVNQTFRRVEPFHCFHCRNMLQLLAPVTNRYHKVMRKVFIDVEPRLILVSQQYFAFLHLQFVHLDHLL